ncbi:protease modulator HflK [Luteolibacter algae]|uniref:Protease modulator HflK n=1 Tax=Luteolibacter algae TaxID=454151 RepID=A0ABW5D4N7_9BACT
MKNLREQGRMVEALLIFLKRLTPVAKWILTILLVIYGFSGIRTIQPSENALVMRLGKLQPRVHGPGMLIAMPSPFDEILVFQTDRDLSIDLDDWMATGEKRASFEQKREMTEAERKEFTIEAGSGQMVTEKLFGDFLDPIKDGYTVTGDTNVVQGLFTLRYRIAQPFEYFSAGETVRTLLSELTYQSLTHALAADNIDNSLTSERGKLIETVVRTVQKNADSLQLGVTITNVEIRSLTPPTQVLAAFEDVINARQFAKTLLESAAAHRDRVARATESEAAQMLSRTQAAANSIVATSTGEARAFEAFAEEFRKSPELNADRLYWDSVDSVMRNVNSRAILPSDRSTPTIMVEPSPEYLR